MIRYRPKIAPIVTLLAALAVVGMGIMLALSTPGAEAQSAPGAVNNLTLTRGDGTVTATWDAPGGATKYHVTYTDNGAQSWSLAALEHTTNSITISNADNSKTYVVGVRAGNQHGWSGWRNSPSAGPYTPPTPTTAPTQAPTSPQPGGLQVTNSGLVSWAMDGPQFEPLIDALFDHFELRWQEKPADGSAISWGSAANNVFIYDSSVMSYQLPNVDASKRYAVKLYLRLKTGAVEFGAPLPTPTPTPTPTMTPTPTPTPVPGTDYDADDDGLIEITAIAQIAELSYDADGDGVPTASGVARYAAVFPNAQDGMGCPDSGCVGYELTADLSFDSGTSWDYVGYDAIFEGNGYTLSNLYINRSNTNRTGLFGILYGNAVIRNLILSSVDVTGKNNVAGLVGVNRGSIVNVTVSGTVTGNESVGGVVGDHEVGSKVTNSSASGTVTGDTYVGGLVGRSYAGSGAVTNSSFSGTVTGRYGVGGLAGVNYGTPADADDITGSSSSGTVTGDEYVGGLVGVNSHNASITTSSSSSAVTGNEYVGGMIGTNSGAVISGGASGTVSGVDYVGGLAGTNSDSGGISGSAANGAVTGEEYVGGLVGSNGSSASISNSNASGDVTGFAYTGTLTGHSSGTITNSQGTGAVNQLPALATASVTSGGLVSWSYELASDVSFSYAQVRWIEKPASGSPNWGDASRYTEWSASASSYQLTGLTAGTEYVVRLFFGLSDNGFKQVKADAGTFTPSG